MFNEAIKIMKAEIAAAEENERGFYCYISDCGDDRGQPRNNVTL